MTRPAPALSLRGISKSFGHVRALDGADLTLRAGTVHALLGENGAGKSTLVRIAFGLERLDAGTIERDGIGVQFRSPRDAMHAGIGMVHQHFSLVPQLTVAENVALGDRGRYTRAAAGERVRRVAAHAGFDVDPHTLVAELSVAAQQRVEILKAFAHDARILILDEPTAVLAPDEITALLRQLRGFASTGAAVLFITHKLHEAREAADEITVLRAGATALVTAAAATDDALVEAMSGARLEARTTHLLRRTGAAVLRLDDVSARAPSGHTTLRNVSCVVHAGEIVGVAGADGSGWRDLTRVLAGRAAPASGRAERPGDIGYVPEDRQRDALILEFSLVENAVLADAAARRGHVRWRDEARATEAWLAEFGVRAASAQSRALELSGGNQQRFVLGRELRRHPRALVVEQPSRGLDVRATAALHERLDAARNAGIAIVVYSSDLDELELLADRVLVCHAGAVTEVPPHVSAMMRALVGAA